MKLFKKRSVLGFAYLAILLVFLIYTLFFTDIRDLTKGYPDAHYINFTSAWCDDSGRFADLRQLSKFSGIRNLRLYNVLPAGIRSGEALNITSHNMFFKVKMGPVVIYDYPPRENYTGKGTGDVYHSISLAPTDSGKQLTIEIYEESPVSEGARFNGAIICSTRNFDYFVFHNLGGEFLLSSLIIFFGLAMIVIYFGIYRDNEFGYDLPALAVGVILVGGWTMIESNVPQLLIGATGTLRTLDYTFLPLMIYPMIRFINSLAKKPKPIYPRIGFMMMVVVLGGSLFLRTVFGVDMHDLQPAFMLSYLFAIAIGAIILVNNHIYCLQEGISEDIGYFYFGAAFFLAGGLIDMVRYSILHKTQSGNGFFLRLGLTIFIVAMFMQILAWLTRERKTNRRDSFVNSLMQYAMSGNSADETICQMQEYMGNELHARCVYLYERTENGDYYCTYAWDEVKGRLPAGTLESTGDREIVENFYYRKFRESGNIVITDREKYKEIAPRLYRTLNKLEISRMIVAPIKSGDEYLGFFGAVDPPQKIMDEVSEIMEILGYFISDAIRRRETEKILIDYSYYDQMTGVRNRRALHEFERTQLDTSQPYGYIMCDINGLKKVNDNEGHEAGDRMIMDVAEALKEVYGRDNVYRMGGDEFAAYDLSPDGTSFANSFARLQIAIRQRGRSASLGHVYRAAGDPDVEAVRKEADAMMYADKERYYSGRMDRRLS